MTDPISPLASDLCTACGICCSGPLFNSVAIRFDELELTGRLGIPVGMSKEDDGLSLEFPCPKLVDKCCTVYEQRPSGCRAFRCELLKGLDDGTMDLGNAFELVEGAWAAVRLVQAELGEESIASYRRRRASALLERNEALPHSAARDRLNDLDAILDRHFRKPHQNQTTPFNEVEGRDGWITVSIGADRSQD